MGHTVCLNIRFNLWHSCCTSCSNLLRYVAWHCCAQFQKMCPDWVVLPRCLHRAVGGAACCMLFRPTNIVSRSEPAVNTDTYIQMHCLHAGRYLFRLQRHIIVHSSAHIVQEKERKSRMHINICVYLVSPGSFKIQIDLPLTSHILFCKHFHTQTILIIKVTVHSHPAPLSV